MKFVWILLLLAIACRLLAGRWPWEFLRAGVRSSDEAQARAVLGVGPDATRDEIVEAHRRLIVRVHPDRGGSGEQVHQANAARDLLLLRLPGTDRR